MKMNKVDMLTQPDTSDKMPAEQRGVRRKMRTSSLEKAAIKKLLSLLDNPDIFIQLPDGSSIFSANKKPESGMIIHNRDALWRFILNPGLNFGEEFGSGGIEVIGDLVEFLQAVISKRPKLHQNRRLAKFLYQGMHRKQNNTLNRAQDNIHHHYDLGNDFYKLWLDKDMVYTCAYYPDLAASLEQAQFAKMDYICRKLNLKPGETVVEAGCGWGSLARHMARYYDVRVKSYNISHQQILEARAQCKALGLEDKIEYVEEDYRNIEGQFDVFVSVGMLEHVGTQHYQELCKTIDRCLSPSGRGLIHSIAQNEAMPMNPWLLKRIFPGGYTPTLREMMGTLEPRGFCVTDVENLRLHYARTLQDWLQRFDAHEQEIIGMYDETFVRMWRLYLAGSIANFTSGDLNLFQVVFTRPAVNNIPLTRAYLYHDDENQLRDNKAWNRVKS